MKPSMCHLLKTTSQQHRALFPFAAPQPPKTWSSHPHHRASPSLWDAPEPIPGRCTWRQSPPGRPWRGFNQQCWASGSTVLPWPVPKQQEVVPSDTSKTTRSTAVVAVVFETGTCWTIELNSRNPAPISMANPEYQEWNESCVTA